MRTGRARPASAAEMSRGAGRSTVRSFASGTVPAWPAAEKWGAAVGADLATAMEAA
jgi:hypothetical protein